MVTTVLLSLVALQLALCEVTRTRFSRLRSPAHSSRSTPAPGYCFHRTQKIERAARSEQSARTACRCDCGTARCVSCHRADVGRAGWQTPQTNVDIFMCVVGLLAYSLRVISARQHRVQPCVTHTVRRLTTCGCSVAEQHVSDCVWRMFCLYIMFCIRALSLRCRCRKQVISEQRADRSHRSSCTHVPAPGCLASASARTSDVC